jgi:hypothetical protein
MAEEDKITCNMKETAENHVASSFQSRSVVACMMKMNTGGRDRAISGN